MTSAKKSPEGIEVIDFYAKQSKCLCA